MAVTLSRNLKLKIDSNLTANAKYNLERIDSLGAIYFNDNTENVQVRSIGSLTFLPNNASTGGSGVGGIISFGSASQPLDAFNVYSASFSLNGSLALLDAASGGNKYLNVRYKSDLNGSTDTTSNRTMSIDVDGADRSIILGGSLTISGGNVTLTGPSSVMLPTTGTLATLAGTETFTNKTIDGLTNTITNLTTDRLRLTGSSFYTDIVPAPSGQLANLQFTLPATDGSATQVLTTDGNGGLSWENAGGSGSGGQEMTATWAAADGTAKVITHSFGTRAIEVEILDINNDYETILVDTMKRSTDNTVTLTASEAPVGSGWLVLLKEITG